MTSNLVTFNTVVVLKVYLDGVTGQKTKPNNSRFERWTVPSPADRYDYIVAYGNSSETSEDFHVLRYDFLSWSGEREVISLGDLATDGLDDDCFGLTCEKIFPLEDVDAMCDAHEFLECCVSLSDAGDCAAWSDRSYVHREGPGGVALPHFTRSGPPAEPADVLICVERRVFSVPATQLNDSGPDFSSFCAYLEEIQACLQNEFTGVLLEERCDGSSTTPGAPEELIAHVYIDDEKERQSIAAMTYELFGPKNTFWGLLDFSEGSISSLDFVIERAYHSRSPSAEGLRGYELAISCYLAVVIGKNYHGKWFRDASGDFRFKASASDVVINPCIWVHNRFKAERSIASQYHEACLKMAEDRRQGTSS